MCNKRRLLLYFLPSFSGVCVFYIIPALFSIYYSMIDSLSTKQFVGLNNIYAVMTNISFQQAFKNTFLFLGIAIPLNTMIAIFLSLALQRFRYGRWIIMILSIIPIAVPSGSIVHFWKFIFNNNGLINRILLSFKIMPISWSDSKISIIIPIIIFIWKTLGITIFIIWIGLSNIPSSYYEIAINEGASSCWRFIHITFIYLIPILFITLILSIINAFKVFRELYILYGEYPNKYLYQLQHYMNNQFKSIDLHKLSSSSMVMAIIFCTFIILLLRIQRKLVDNNYMQNLGEKIYIKTKAINSYILHAFVIIFAFCMFFPLFFQLVNSLISNFPLNFSLHQYKHILLNPTYLRAYWNSIALVIPIVLGQITISPLAAFYFEYGGLKIKENIYFVYILLMIMPMQILLVPHYIIANWLNIHESWWAIILPGIFNPFGVFFLRQYMKNINRECIEAAQIDGATMTIIFKSIVLPIIKPAISVLIILSFSEYWNIVDQGIIFIKSQYNEPLSLYLSRNTDFAGACLYVIPAIIVFLYFNDAILNAFSGNKIINKK